MKLVMLDGKRLSDGCLDYNYFNSIGNFNAYDRTADKKEILNRLKDAEIVLTGGTVIDKEIIDACPMVKYIGATATGYNHIDVEYANSKGIIVTNVPQYASQIVPQSAFALLLAICNRTESISDRLKNGKWMEITAECALVNPLIELQNKTLGIIGFGNIGRKSGEIGASFGMKVVYSDREPVANNFGAQFVDREELFMRSDIIFLHCPLLPSTKNIINKETIAKMKDGVIIINNARGGIIVEDDLAEALNSGKIRGAGLDAFEVEPLPIDSPLVKAKNCIITPHISWSSYEAKMRIFDTVKLNVQKYLEGNPVNEVRT